MQSGASWRGWATTGWAITGAVILCLGSCRWGLDNQRVGDGGFVVPPGCGDGVLGAGEECDDGDFDNNDACLENCRWASCGDGVVRAEVETCDDGNDNDDDGCTQFCGACPVDADGRYTSVTTQSCYTRNLIPNRFPGADDQCVVQGGRLVAFSTAAEHAEVSAALPLEGPTWIGLQNLNNGGWKWISGEAETFSNWAAGFPDTERLGVQLASGEWQSIPDAPLPFLCELGGSPWRVRPEDGHAYARFRTPVAWEVAEAECQRIGAHLAVITSAEEEVFIREEIGVGLDPSFDGWIGHSDLDEDGVFVSVNGEPLGFTNWDGGQPNLDGYCVIHEAAWSDRACADQNAYYCEIDD